MKALSPQQVLQDGFTLPKTLLLYGEELQLISECRQAIKQRFNSRNTQYAYLDALAESTAAVDQNSSLFGTADPYLTVVIGFAKPDKAHLDALANMIARANTPNLLVVELHNISDKKAAWFRAILDADGVQPVYAPVLDAKAAHAWITRFAKEQQVALNTDAVNFLADHTEGNLMAAKQTIIKMRLMGAQSSADSDKVRTTLSDGAIYTVFDLTDTILAGSATRALKILYHLRVQSDIDPLIIWSLGNIVNNVLAVQSGKQVRAWGKQLAQLKQLAKKMDGRGAARIIHNIAYADRVVKGNAVGDAEAAISHAIVQLAAMVRDIRIHLPFFQVNDY